MRSVTFTGFAMKGALNLNNEEAGVPNWKGYNCNNEPLQSEAYTIYDGMMDGKEGTGYTASSEKVREEPVQQHRCRCSYLRDSYG